MRNILTALLIITPFSLSANYDPNCQKAEETVARSVPLSLNVSIGLGGVRVTASSGPQIIPNHQSMNWRFHRYLELKASFPEAFAETTADKLDFVLERALVPPNTIKDAAALRDWIETHYRAEKIKSNAKNKFPGAFSDIWLNHEWLDGQLDYLSKEGALAGPEDLPNGIDGPDFKHWLTQKHIDHLIRNKLEVKNRHEMFDALIKNYENKIGTGFTRPSEGVTYHAIAEVSGLVDGFDYARKIQEDIGWMREHLQYSLTKHIDSNGRLAPESPEEITRQRERLNRAEMALKASPWAELLTTYNQHANNAMDPYNANGREAVIVKINSRVALQYGLDQNYVQFVARAFAADEGYGRSVIIIDKVLPSYGRGFYQMGFEDFFKSRTKRQN